MSEIQTAKNAARRAWRKLFPRGLGADIQHVKGPNTNIPMSSDHCRDHWENIAYFGQCWKHNPDGSLKSTFTKKQ
jgi:hypothetical protein